MDAENLLSQYSLPTLEAERIAQSEGTYQEDRAEADQFNRDGVDD